MGLLPPMAQEVCLCSKIANSSFNPAAYQVCVWPLGMDQASTEPRPAPSSTIPEPRMEWLPVGDVSSVYFMATTSIKANGQTTLHWELPLTSHLPEITNRPHSGLSTTTPESFIGQVFVEHLLGVGVVLDAEDMAVHVGYLGHALVQY